MPVTLWLRGPAQLVIPPAALHAFAARLGPGRWQRALYRAVLGARVRYWFQEWAFATHHPRALFDLRQPGRLTVTVIKGEIHAG
jgi:hypothetical protein